VRFITKNSAIYIDPVNRNLHISLEANFTGEYWNLQTDTIQQVIPPVERLSFDASTAVFFNRDKESWRGSSENRGTILLILSIGGFQIRRHIFQSKGMMTPVVIPGSHYRFKNPVSLVRIDLQYQGENGANFEFHVTAVMS